MPDYTVTLSDDDAATLVWALSNYRGQPNVPPTPAALVARIVVDQVGRWRQVQKRSIEERVREALRRTTTDVRAKVAPALERLAQMSPEQQIEVLDRVATTRVKP